MRFYTNVAMRGDTVLLKGYNDGEYIEREVKYQPYLFLPTQNKTDYKTLDGKAVEKKSFKTIRQARKFVKDYNDVAGFEIFGLNNYTYPFIYEKYNHIIDYDSKKIRVAYLDIEVAFDKGFPEPEEAKNEVTAITVGFRDFKIVFGCGDYKEHIKGVKYYKFTDEEALLRGFLEIWEKIRPDVITGWYVEVFDVPYLVNRIIRILGEEAVARLSSWGIIEPREMKDRGKVKNVYNIVGTSILDYIRLYHKFTYVKRESYKLGFIAEVELGETKVDYGEYKDLEDLRKRNFQKYIEYNIHDINHAERLEKKLGLLEIIYAIAFWGKVNFEDAFSPVRTWDVIIHNYLMDKKIVIPQKKESINLRNLVGAFVKIPQTGRHEWVISFDLASLYPHLIMMYNISPEMFRGMINKNIPIDEMLQGALSKFKDTMIEQEVTMAANLCLFSKESLGFLPALMHRFYNERDSAKKKMLDVQAAYEKNKSDALETEKSRLYNLQMALKILLNSLYGSLSNEFFRWYDINLAEAITMSGQLSIKWIEVKINTFLNEHFGTKGIDYIIAMDTDSMYIKAESFVTQMDTTDHKEIARNLDKISQEIITPVIQKAFAELAEYTNAYEQSMNMKREVIASTGIWTAKKRYMLNVLFNEKVEYEKPELKITGIEAVKSSTPKACREAIKTGIRIIMNGTEQELQEHIANFKKEFMKMKFEDIASPTSVNGVSTYYDANTIYKTKTPGHTRGALIYNHMIKKLNLNHYQPINDGDKVRFGYLKEPNIHHTDVLSVTDDGIPPEFNLESFIDYNKQFEKSFLTPMKTILNCINWSTEERATLRRFFKK